MRRRHRPAAQAEGSVPEPIRAGPCIEVWTPDGNSIAAMRRWKDARARWLWHAHGLHHWDHAEAPEGARVSLAPWSWRFLMAEDPDRLAELLARRGLPDGWRPTPADPEDFGDPPPRMTYWQWRELRGVH